MCRGLVLHKTEIIRNTRRDEQVLQRVCFWGVSGVFLGVARCAYRHTRREEQAFCECVSGVFLGVARCAYRHTRREEQDFCERVSGVFLGCCSVCVSAYQTRGARASACPARCCPSAGLPCRIAARLHPPPACEKKKKKKRVMCHRLTTVENKNEE